MSVYDFQAISINGKAIELSDYRGKVLLIVNTASMCSFSSQFADLQKLYERRREQGFEILAFPCNQFNEKEPGSNSEVQGTCQIKHGVTLYLTQQAPFQGFDTQAKDGQWMDDFLQDKYPEIYVGDGIKWNFSKFLIDRGGYVKARFEVTTATCAIDPVIESLL
ncbi:glutathione peroxidase [Paenibacillus polymyxa]|uniref:glutathione peroxidase n=1 Tax=Paenibacillus polymyxa TaxID=1406 RepID=UPI0021E38E14|nr:redoxin domain-containing protein [Paenibacillus polymyxa]